MRCYIKAFKNYCKINGRATRKELWLFLLFHYLIVVVLSFLDGFFGFYSEASPLAFGYLTLAYLAASTCPGICVQVRRLHDVNKSGWWWLLSIVPLACLYIIYLYVEEGDRGPNQYGPSPVAPRDAARAATQVCVPSPAQAPAPPSPVMPEPAIAPPPRICFCRNCGFELIAGSAFCSCCGTAVIKQ